jgi:putative ABC transport system permease protein
MPYFEAIRLALAQLRAQKLKSFFTLLGVIVGVTFLIAVVSIVEGMGRYVEDDFLGRMLGVNTFTLRSRANFSEEATVAGQRLAARRPPILPSDVDPVVDALPAGTEWAVQTPDFASFPATSPFAKPRNVRGIAVEGDYFSIKSYKLAAGRVFSRQEAEVGANVIVIGDEVAKYFFPQLDPIGRTLNIRNEPYTIVGLIERQGSVFGESLDGMAIAPFRSSLGRIASPRGSINGILVRAPSMIVLADAMEATREVMRARHQLRPAQPDDFYMETSQAAMDSFREFLKIMTIAGSALPAIGLVVSGMVIMNIMLVAVAERTREIGIRKALGARRKDILRQFVVEAATLSTVGAMIGVALGIIAAKIVEMTSPLPAAVAPWSVVAATLLGTVVGIVAGVYPASRASRLDPIEALRQET